MITANHVLITSKPATWELPINYFKQHYRNKRTVAGNLKRPSLHISSHSGWKQPGIKLVQMVQKCSISNDLDGIEDDVLWAVQYDKSDTDSDEEGDDMYDDIHTNTTDVQWREWSWWIFGFCINIANFSESYERVRLIREYIYSTSGENIIIILSPLLNNETSFRH